MNINARTVKSLNLISFALFLVFSSCAQVQVKTPSARFISPEASGKALAGNIQIFQQSGTEGTVNISGNEIEKELELRNNVSPLAASVGLGLVEKADLIYYSYDDSAPLLGLKFQIMGETAQQAKKGNHSLAVTIGGGTSESETKDDDIFNSSDNVDTTRISQRLWDASVIYGLRTSDDTLLYTSLQLTQHVLELKVDSSDSNLDGEKLEIQTTNIGASIGVTRYFKRMRASLEASAQQTNWTNNDPTTFAFVSASLGWFWH